MKTILKLIPLLLALGVSQAQGATLYGTQATKYLNTEPPKLASQGTLGGRVKSCYDSYTLTGDLSVNDVIKLCQLPENARIVDARIVTTALSAGVIDVGWPASGDEGASTTILFNGIPVTSAANYSLAGNQAVNGAYQKTLTDPVQVQALIRTDTSATSGTIQLEVFYVVD